VYNQELEWWGVVASVARSASSPIIEHSPSVCKPCSSANGYSIKGAKVAIRVAAAVVLGVDLVAKAGTQVVALEAKAGTQGAVLEAMGGLHFPDPLPAPSRVLASTGEEALGVGAQGSRCVRLAQPRVQGVCSLEAAEAIAEAAIQAALPVDKEAMVALAVMEVMVGLEVMEVVIQAVAMAVTEVVMVVTAALEVMVAAAMVDKEVMAATGVAVTQAVVMAATEAAAIQGVVPEEGMAVMEVVIQAVALEVGMEVMAATAMAVIQGVASAAAMAATGGFTKTFLSAIRIKSRHSKRQLVVPRRFQGMGARHFPALRFLRVTQGVFLVVRDQRGSRAIANPHGLGFLGAQRVL
jgi:hypothetical protein